MDDQWNNEYAPVEAEQVKRKREPLFNIPGVIIAVIVLTTAIQFLVSYVLDVSAVDELYYYGGFIPARYGGQLGGEWLAAFTSPVTYAFLHGGWEHLIFNLAWLTAFGTPVAARLGTVRFVLLWLVTSVLAAFAFDAANFAGVALLVGASGAISGLTGAGCRFVWAGRGLRIPAQLTTVPALPVMAALRNRQVIIFTAFWFLANVVLAASGFGTPGGAQAIAWEAHLGGFLAGFFLFPLFDPVKPSRYED